MFRRDIRKVVREGYPHRVAMIASQSSFIRPLSTPVKAEGQPLCNVMKASDLHCGVKLQV